MICHALSAVVQRTVKTCSRIAHQKTLGIGCHKFTAKAAQSQKNWLLVHAGDHLHSVCHLRWLRLQPGPQLMQQCCSHLQTHYASNWRWYRGRKGKSFHFSHGDHVQGSQHHSSSHSLPGSTEALSFSLCMPRLRAHCSHSPATN